MLTFNLCLPPPIPRRNHEKGVRGQELSCPERRGRGLTGLQ